MSKVVKKVGRAVGNVVKGAVNVVKKVAKSKLGKAVLTAAAVYFGGAALIGATGGGAAGIGATAGGWAGAAEGIGAAWNGLTAAASSVASSITGGGSASTTATGAVDSAAAFTGATETGLATVAGEGAAASSGLLGTAGNVASAAWNSLGAYGKAAAIQAGTQLYAANQAGKAAEEQANAQAAQYNANVGGQIYSDAPRPRPMGMLQQVQQVQQVQPTQAPGIQSGQFGNSTMYTLAPYQSNSGGLLAQLQQQRQALMNARYA